MSWAQKSIQESTWADSKKLVPNSSVSLRIRATYRAIAFASNIEPLGVSNTGTLPKGDFFKKSAVLLSFPKTFDHQLRRNKN
jgi:hypothetical protein